MKTLSYKWKLLMHRNLFLSLYPFKKRNFPTYSNGVFEETVSSKRINRILEILPNDAHYLEIGIENARTFVNVRSIKKIGVDPFPLISTKGLPVGVEILLVESDTFFESFVSKVDFVFIDGLHTWDQTYKDIINSLNCGSEDVILLVDDVIPCDRYAAMRDQIACQVAKKEHGINDNYWMGDVYKVVEVINRHYPMLSFCTIVEMGENPQTVIWRNTSKVDLPMIDINLLEVEMKGNNYDSTFRASVPQYFNSQEFQDVMKGLKEGIESRKDVS